MALKNTSLEIVENSDDGVMARLRTEEGMEIVLSIQSMLETTNWGI